MAELNHTFNPNSHLMQISKKDYLPVQWRLAWINDVVDRAAEEGKEVSLEIDTEEIICDPDKEVTIETSVWNNNRRCMEKVMKTAPGYAKYRATVTLKIGNVVKHATATKNENAASFAEYTEKAETGAIGRALAMIGFGTQFAPEFDEEQRIVDSPVANNNGSTNNHTANNSAPRDENAEASITEQQVSSIRKLCQHLGKSEPDNVTKISFLAAKRLIQTLTAEYKERQANKAS